MDHQFNADDAYRQYKRIRNYLSTLETTSFIYHAIVSLHETYYKGIESLRKSPPWNTLVLIKWAIEQWNQTAHRRKPTLINDFIKSVNLMHEMEEFLRLPSDYGDISFYMRATAFRQFPLQQSPHLQPLARQELLFCGMEDNHRFRANFRAITGLDYNVFTELGLGLIVLIISHPKKLFFREQDFQVLTPKLGKGDIGKVFKHLSATLPEMVDLMRSKPFPRLKDGQRDINHEVMLPSPLFEKPLLRVDDRFFIFHPTLLVRSLETIVHRTLRHAGNDFPSRFGYVFERHIENCMKDAGIKYVPEKTLQQLLPKSDEPKCVDFVIFDGGSNILIDAKGVEVAERKRAAYAASHVASSVETSVLKGIRQAFITLERARRLSSPAVLQFNDGESFLVIVTYGDLNLGLSSDLGRMFIDEVEKLKARFGEPLPIPLENIFFLTSADFEQLMALSKVKKIAPLEVLQKAKARDANPRTAKFLFSMHLSEELLDEDKLPMLPIMNAAIDRLQARCISRFPV